MAGSRREWATQARPWERAVRWRFRPGSLPQTYAKQTTGVNETARADRKERK